MRYLVSGEQMKEIDRYTIEEIGIPSLVLMERAALAVAEEVERNAALSDEILFACGSGNNGADGVAAARMLKEKGYRVSVLMAGNREKGTKELNLQLEIAQKLDVLVMDYGEFLPGKCDVLVDALFGVGLTRDIEGKYKEVIGFLESLNPGKTIAVDIPSGIHSGTGAVMGCALQADVTVTFGYEKLGTALYPGRTFAGRVVVADIGFPDISRRQAGQSVWAYEREDIKRIPKRRADGNKGTFGRVLIVAGAKNMGGAAFLSALAAYRTGAGLVEVMTPEENRLIIQEKLPEAVAVTYHPKKIMESQEERDRFSFLVEKECRRADVVVLGPGLGQEAYAALIVKNVLTFVCSPLIIDADGLNIIAANKRLTGYYTENVIITPHLGEMARLMETEISEIKGDLTGTAAKYAGEFGITCVLKDAAAVVAEKDGGLYVNTSGTSAMAKGGSGDVLTGMIAGLIAQGMEEGEAARMGVYLHGLCGEEAARKQGVYGVLAHEIADEAGKILNKLPSM